MSVAYIYWREGWKYEHAYDTLDEALDAALADFEGGVATYDSIEDRHGTVLMTRSQLQAAIFARVRAWNAT